MEATTESDHLAGDWGLVPRLAARDRCATTESDHLPGDWGAVQEVDLTVFSISPGGGRVASLLDAVQAATRSPNAHEVRFSEIAARHSATKRVSFCSFLATLRLCEPFALFRLLPRLLRSPSACLDRPLYDHSSPSNNFFAFPTPYRNPPPPSRRQRAKAMPYEPPDHLRQKTRRRPTGAPTRRLPGSRTPHRRANEATPDEADTQDPNFCLAVGFRATLPKVGFLQACHPLSDAIRAPIPPSHRGVRPPPW